MKRGVIRSTIWTAVYLAASRLWWQNARAQKFVRNILIASLLWWLALCIVPIAILGLVSALFLQLAGNTQYVLPALYTSGISLLFILLFIWEGWRRVR